MNAANFHEYLRNPSMLHQVNYQELKSLVLQYPYATNLRYLMLVKSLLDGHRDYDRHLVQASLSSIDRQKLQQLVKLYSTHAEKNDNYNITEEFLELKDLSTLEDVLEAGTAKKPTPKAAAADLPVAASELEFLDDVPAEPTAEPHTDLVDEQQALPALEDLIEESASTDTLPATNDGLDDLFEMDKPLVNRPKESDIEELEIEESLEGLFDVPLEEEIEGALPEEATEEMAIDASLPANAASVTAESEIENMDANSDLEGQQPKTAEIPLEITNQEADTSHVTPPGPAPTPKSTFSSYAKRYQPKRPGLLSGDVKLLGKGEKKEIPASISPEKPLEESYQEPADVAKEMAAQSVHEDHTIATETLAGILARQGHFDKAIKMYEKLSLQFPEKSDTFAAKIEELKNK